MKAALPWGQRFELTRFTEVARGFGYDGRRRTVFVDEEGTPRKMNGDVTSCPRCCTCPCSCDCNQDGAR